MALFVFVHGGGDVGATYDLAGDELRALGHDAVAPDLPTEDPDAGLEDYAAVVCAAAAGREDVIVVGHSLGGFAATLAAARMAPQALVLLSAMIPAPGEPPGDWWAATGYGAAVEEAEDPFFHDVPAELAERASALERGQEAKPMEEPWPLDAWPGVPTRYPAAARRSLLPAALHAPGGPRAARDRAGRARRRPHGDAQPAARAGGAAGGVRGLTLSGRAGRRRAAPPRTSRAAPAPRSGRRAAARSSAGCR